MAGTERTGTSPSWPWCVAQPFSMGDDRLDGTQGLVLFTTARGRSASVSLNKMNSFFSNGDKLESDEEGSLHYVEVIVDMEVRQGLQVHGS